MQINTFELLNFHQNLQSINPQTLRIDPILEDIALKLQTYGTTKEKSLQAKVDVYTAFSSNLRRLADHIYQSKPFQEKLLFHFRYASPEEERLYQLLKQTDALFKHYQDQIFKLYNGSHLILRGFGLLGLTIQRLTKGFLTLGMSPAEKLNQVAFRILANNKLNCPQLNGATFYNSLQTVLKNLTQFRQTICQKEDAENRFFNGIDLALIKTENALKQSVDWSLQISHLRAIEKIKNHFLPAFWFEADPQQSANMEARLADIAYSIQTAILNLKPGDQLIIPGGYFTEDGGHALLFEVSCQSLDQMGSYTLKIINTGNGTGEFDNIFSFFWNFCVTGQFCDYQLSDLNLDAIQSQDFLIDLIRPAVIPQPKEQAVQNLFTPIFTHLQKTKDDLEKGPPHHIQTNGTCAYECTMVWLESILPPTVFQSFEIFATHHALIKAERYPQKFANNIRLLQGQLNQSPLLAGEAFWDKIKEVGTLTLESRKQVLQSTFEKIHERLNQEIINHEKQQDELAQTLSDLTAQKQIETYKSILNQDMINARDAYCQATQQQSKDDPQPPNKLNRVWAWISSQAKSESELWNSFQGAQTRYQQYNQKSLNPDFIQSVDIRIAKIEEEFQTLDQQNDFNRQEIAFWKAFRTKVNAFT